MRKKKKQNSSSRGRGETEEEEETTVCFHKNEAGGDGFKLIFRKTSLDK